MAEEKAVRTGKACEMLGVTIKVLMAMVRENQIPFVKMGIQLRFYPSQLEKWKKESSYIDK